MNADETGVRAEGKLVWAYSVSTEMFTYQYISKKRGQNGMEEADFLPSYKGTLIHDCWMPYWAFPVRQHALCLEHILRELQGVLDNDARQEWAE